MKKIALLVIFAAFLLPHSASAQQPSGIHSFGQDFYVVQLSSSRDCLSLRSYQAYFALISSYYRCVVTVSYFNSNGTETVGQTYVLSPREGTQVPLDESYMHPRDQNGNPLFPDGEVPEYTACHIHATEPISVSCYSSGPNTGGLYLALQTGALGRNYVVAALPANPGQGAANGFRASNCALDSSSSEFAVLAVHDSTKVTIIPNGLTRKGETGTSTGLGANGTEHPIHVTLARGQVYWVKSVLDDATDDESGSIVQADHPVAVFAGNEDAFHGTSGPADLGNDQRNLVIQQMIPTEYLRSSGYVSIPFLDPSGLDSADGSAGDEYKVYAADSLATTLNFSVINTSAFQQTISLPQANRLPHPIFASFDNVDGGTNASANRKIMVEQYDYRAHTTSGPSTAPAMMNVVPLKNFERSFMFEVPDDKYWNRKARYINVIARKDQFQRIFLIHNGSLAPAYLSSLPQAGGSYSIPQHSELEGRRYEISSGSYYVYGDSAFIVYQYGMLGIDPDNDLGDDDGDDYYFEYAAPAGESFGIDGAGVPVVNVDTVCNGWNITALDTAELDDGIAEVIILNDSLGIYTNKPNSDSGYVSSNVDFSERNFTVVPGSTSVTSKIIVDNPLVRASGWVMVTNGGGNSKLLHLTYTPAKFALNSDSILFYNLKPGIDTCTQLVLHNGADTSGLILDITSARFLSGNQGFFVSGVNPTLPRALKAGDSLVFTICFKPDTADLNYIDTLAIQTGCFTIPIKASGASQIGRINALNRDFGSVLVGHKSCATVLIWNGGDAPFTLTKQWILDNTTDFTFEDSSMLPLTLAPGVNSGVNLTFCYTPKDTGEDSTQMHWGSDMPAPYSAIYKNYSILKGRGIAPELNWDVPELEFASENARVRRAILLDSGNASANVDSVEITGPDTSEFHILAMQNVPPFTLFPVDVLGGQTSEWIDIAFTPDTTNLKDRRDTLIAFDQDNIRPILLLNGIIGYSSVRTPQAPQADSIQLRQVGGLLHVQLSSRFANGARLTIFDELGRIICSIEENTPMCSIDLSNLPNGTYYLRATNGNRSTMAPFVLIK